MPKQAILPAREKSVSKYSMSFSLNWRVSRSRTQSQSLVATCVLRYSNSLCPVYTTAYPEELVVSCLSFHQPHFPADLTSPSFLLLSSEHHSVWILMVTFNRPTSSDPKPHANGPASHFVDSQQLASRKSKSFSYPSRQIRSLGW